MTKIKICGLSRFEDIAAVNAAQPDYIGFVFAKSKRQVD
ncbi:MAG: N-(5'-phosphoribosyl)anthranilate isomerase, partial [Firmicutes bacterium HGW-Firmicutes-17]